MKRITIFILLLFCLGGCKEQNRIRKNANKVQTDRHLAQEKDTYRQTIAKLNKDFFKNYYQIEKVVLDKLAKDGSEYFIQNNCFDLLGKFESTLALFCQICEELNINNTGGLLTSYLHLNDTTNVKRQYERMQHDENAFIYKEFHNYEDAGKTLESKYLSIKYDKRVEAFANAVFTHADDIESFMSQEWGGLLPPKIRVMLLYSDGPGPYNPNLNETFLPVKSKPIDGSLEVAGYIVHETFHLVNTNLLAQKCKFAIDPGMNSFKFLDEGAAQLIESKFMGTYHQRRVGVDEYAKRIALSNSFDFKDLKTNWFALFSSPDVHIYYLAFSFAYFLEAQYGAEKYQTLFLPTAEIAEESWLAYVERYFGSSVDELMEEWKETLVQQSSNDK